MSYYKERVYISEPVGNNAISYEERKALGSEGKICIPAIISGKRAQITLGDQLVFEEVEDGKLISCTGLDSLVTCTYNNVPVCVMDNHNHALYFWCDALHKGLISKGVALIHIDQHADMNEPDERLDDARVNDMDYIAEYVNTKTQIASFIEPALDAGLISECIQIRSEAKLEELQGRVTSDELQGLAYVLDIDIDFFAHEFHSDSKIKLIKKLMPGAALITIATSPSFIDQKRAVELVQQLLS